MNLDQVKKRFLDEGITFADFARTHGFKYCSVIAVVNGINKGRYGEAHRIAVALGLKPDVQGEL